MSASPRRVIAATGLLLLLGACTPADERRLAAEPERSSFARYAVAYGARSGIVEVDLAERTFCSREHVEWARAGHLHQRGPRADPVVLTLFEPPEPNLRTVCIDDVEAEVLERIVDEPRSYYLDFHEADRGGREVRGKLRVSVGGLEIDVAGPAGVRGGEDFRIEVAARDGDGEIRGILVRFGDGRTWGSLPFDLVCASSSTSDDDDEGPSSVEDEARHAYRRAGTYIAKVIVTSGGCFTPAEEVRTETKVVVVGDARSSNGPFDPKAKIGHAYYVNGRREVLVSDIGGYDADGYVYWVRVDWGDGTPRELMRRGLGKCHAGRSWPEGWMSDQMRHRYPKRGEYEVVVKVRSTGCDGRNAQADTTRRVLEYPPTMGS